MAITSFVFVTLRIFPRKAKYNFTHNRFRTIQIPSQTLQNSFYSIYLLYEHRDSNPSIELLNACITSSQPTIKLHKLFYSSRQPLAREHFSYIMNFTTSSPKENSSGQVFFPILKKSKTNKYTEINQLTGDLLWKSVADPRAMTQ